jgi:hypothetical protein
VRVRRDRFAIVIFRVDDGHATIVPIDAPSPFEGKHIAAYHGAIFGSAQARLRWTDALHLDVEIAVTRHDAPQSRTFVTRGRWNATTAAFDTPPAWVDGSAAMGGDEPQQLARDREVIAVRGDEGMGCAIVIVEGNAGAARPVIETAACRSKYRSGYTAEVVAGYRRRAAIERAQLIQRTHADLVDRARAKGLPEGQAMLDASEEMSRLGLFPKQTMLVATRAACDGTMFDISDEELRVGLFPDIERALAAPGTPVHKSMGDYVTHTDYTTSRRLNEYLSAGHTRFTVRAHGACWSVRIER